MPEPSACLEGLFDERVGIEDALAAEQLDRFEEVAGRVDRRVDVQAVLGARQEVVGAVSRRGMHRAGSLLERHVLGQHAD